MNTTHTFVRAIHSLIGKIDDPEASELVWATGKALMTLQQRFKGIAAGLCAAFLKYELRLHNRERCKARRFSEGTMAGFLGRRRISGMSAWDYANLKYNCLGTGFLDHGSLWKNRKSGKQILRGEPYQLDLEDLRKIVAFCEEFKLDVFIHGQSQHYPAWTVSVEFTKAGGYRTGDGSQTKTRRLMSEADAAVRGKKWQKMWESMWR